MKLIDKSALVAEMERRRDDYINSFMTEQMHMLNDVIDFINTLEMKEVDLEEEIDKEWNKCEPIDEGMGLEIASIEHEQFDNIAKHFFKLGLNSRHES